MDSVLTMHEQKYISGFKVAVVSKYLFHSSKQNEIAKHPMNQAHNKNSVIKNSLIHIREECIIGTR